MNWEEFKSKSLDDIGTRYLHYSDLLAVWEEAKVLIESYSHVGKHDQTRIDTINSCLDLLRNTLDGMGEYQDRIVGLRKLVDWVPSDPSVIPEGRGTPLKKRLGDGNDKG